MKRFKLMQDGVDYPVCQVEVESEPLPSTLAVWAQMGGQVVVEDITAEFALRQVHQARVREYPPLADLADALFHQQVNGDDSFLTAYFSKVAAVKAKHPKP